MLGNPEAKSFKGHVGTYEVRVHSGPMRDDMGFLLLVFLFLLLLLLLLIFVPLLKIIIAIIITLISILFIITMITRFRVSGFGFCVHGLRFRSWFEAVFYSESLVGFVLILLVLWLELAECGYAYLGTQVHVWRKFTCR